LQTIASSDKYPVYDSLDEEVVKSYLEYSLASLIYYAMKEAACSEQSSRMSAMDNASKNAGKYLFS
jgi:F-type H+-transporting ATPase subunit gamma